jgi:hypothetical protein
VSDVYNERNMQKRQRQNDCRHANIWAISAAARQPFANEPSPHCLAWGLRNRRLIHSRLSITNIQHLHTITYSYVASTLFLRRHIAICLLSKGTMVSRLGIYSKRVQNISHLDGYFSRLLCISIVICVSLHQGHKLGIGHSKKL